MSGNKYHKNVCLGLLNRSTNRSSWGVFRTVFVVVRFEPRPAPRCPAPPLPAPFRPMGVRVLDSASSEDTSRKTAYRPENRRRKVMPWAHRPAQPSSRRPRRAPPRPNPPRTAWPPCPAPRCPASPFPAHGICRFPDMACMNKIYTRKKQRSIGQQPGMKSGCGPGGAMVVNWLPPGRRVPPFGLKVI